MKDTDRAAPPAENGEAVILPPAGALPDLVQANAVQRASYDFRILDVPAPEFAEQVRADVLRLACEYTAGLGVDVDAAPSGWVVATGHQPTLPHPGVWLKNHLAWRLARAVGGTGLHFVVDNDAVGLEGIGVPAAEADGLAVKTVPFIGGPPDVAAEEVRVRGDAQGALAEVARIADEALKDSLAAEFAAAAAPTESVVDFVTRPRRRLEERFGVHNLELPVSRLCSTGGFRLFCEHIAADAERFASLYNAALDRHRAERGITNPVVPAPNLGRKGGEIELPFWVWRPGEVRRPLLVAADAPVESLRGLLRAGFKVRPRALPMTMFFRLFCCDMFIHGTGGARYEPVNDDVIRGFFGVDPPGYVTASATLFVEPKTPVPAAGDPAELRQRIRRMEATPERFTGELLPGDAEARELARRRIELRDPPGGSRRDRRAAFAESKKLAARLRERIAPRILVAQQELERSERSAAMRAVIENREYPFFLHSRAALERLYSLAALRPDAPGQDA